MKQSAGPVHPPGSRPCASTSDFTCRQTLVSLNGLHQRFDLFSAAQQKPSRPNDDISNCDLHQRRLRPNAVDQPRKSALERRQRSNSGCIHCIQVGIGKRSNSGIQRSKNQCGMAKRGGTFGCRPCSPAHLVEQGLQFTVCRPCSSLLQTRHGSPRCGGRSACSCP